MNWHVVICKPSNENLVSQKLNAGGFEVFYPKLKKYYPKLKKEKVIPLFSKYIFVKFDTTNDYKTITYTRGVSKILCFLGVPALVNEAIIDSLKTYCDATNIIAPKFMQKEAVVLGDRIKITSGVLEGVEGIVSGVHSDKERIEILIDLIKVTTKKEFIQKIDAVK